MVHETAVREVYSYEEVLQSSLDYFKQDELAATTWINKYALKNKDGLFLEKNPDDMHKRMAKAFAKIEARYKPAVEAREELSKYGQNRKTLKEKDIYRFFKDFKYVIPQGSVMYGLGNEEVVASLSNCVVQLRSRP